MNEFMGPDLYAVGGTDIGCHRTENQDAFYINNERGLFIVADGMGGVTDGAKASRYVIDNFPDMVFAAVESHKKDGEPLTCLLDQCIRTVSDNLRRDVGENSGTTLVFALRVGDLWYIGNVGDSRAYTYVNQELNQITIDHNIAAYYLSIGRLSPEQAKSSPFRHMLMQAVGSNNGLEPDIFVIQNFDGQYILLASDGLTGMVPDLTIKEILSEPGSIDQKPQRLLAEALQAGGLDNVTLILICMPFSSVPENS